MEEHKDKFSKLKKRRNKSCAMGRELHSAPNPCCSCPYRVGHEELCWPCWKNILGQPGGRTDAVVVVKGR